MTYVVNVVFVKWGNKYNDDQLVTLFEQIYNILGDWQEDFASNLGNILPRGDKNLMRVAGINPNTAISEYKFRYRFYCDGFDWDKYDLPAKHSSADIQYIQIPKELNLKGVWNKLSMFRKEFPVEGKVLYFDLDTIIKDDFTKMIFAIDWSKLTMVDCHWKKIGRAHV